MRGAVGYMLLLVPCTHAWRPVNILAGILKSQMSSFVCKVTLLTYFSEHARRPRGTSACACPESCPRQCSEYQYTAHPTDECERGRADAACERIFASSSSAMVSAGRQIF